MGEELTGKTVGDENDLKSPQISAQESNQEQQTEQMIKTVIDEDRTARSDEKGYWGNLGWGGRNIYQDWRDNHFERREMIIDAIKLSSLSEEQKFAFVEHLDGHALKRLQNRQAELRESPDFPDDFMERWENINELYTREEHYDAFTKRWIDGDASSDTFISRADRIRKSRISEYHRHQNEANYYRKIIEGQNPHGVLKEAGIKVSRLMPSIPAPLKPLEEMDENELLSAYLLGYPTKREIEEAPQKVKEFEDQMEGVIKTIKQLEELATMVREKPEIYSIVLEAIANIKVIRWLAEKLEETESIRQDPDGSKAWLADAYYPFYLHKKKEE